MADFKERQIEPTSGETHCRVEPLGVGDGRNLRLVFLSGCKSIGRHPDLDSGSWWFESTRPDHF